MLINTSPKLTDRCLRRERRRNRRIGRTHGYKGSAQKMVLFA